MLLPQEARTITFGLTRPTSRLQGEPTTRPGPPISVPMVFVQGMLSGAQARGWPACTLLAEAGIESPLLEQAGARVTGDQYVALFRLLLDRLGDDGLGFFSRTLRRGSFAMIVRAGLGTDNLEVAMRRMAHTFRLLQDDVDLVPVAGRDRAGWSLEFSPHAGSRPNFMHEFLLRIFWRTLAWLIAARLAAHRFDLAFPSPAYAPSYRNVLPGELRFGQLRSALWFDRQALKAPVRRDEQALRAFLADAQWNILLPRRDSAASTRVRLHLLQALPAWPDLARTASAMHMSASTLHRHLAAEHTSFQALKDELRRDIAINRLNTSSVPLAVLAAELGFSDNAAFQRAFKCWTGSPPGAYRRGQAQ